jgi:hypothetical protein
MSQDPDRTASLMSPAKLAQMKPKAAASPAAWLDQMASDAGHTHVHQLAQLTRQLQAQTAGADDAQAEAAVAASLRTLREALPQLDVGLLQPRGWLARATGKARTAGAEFASQFGRIDQAAQGFRAQASVLQKRQAGRAGGAERTLVEFEVEWRAIEKIIDQGARWLHDMRTQLKDRQAQAADDAAQQRVREDATRCELLVARLKLLRALATGAQQVRQHAQASAARRAALLHALQQCVGSELKQWQARWAPVAAAAGDSGSPALGLEGPQEAREALERRLAQLEADQDLLRTEDKALAESLAALAAQLQAA